MSDERERAPWDQLPGEPDVAYARFLLYRNLGPARSLEKAYGAFLSTIEDESAQNRVKPRASGTWCEDSAQYKWVARAVAWDVDSFKVLGTQFVVRYVEVLNKLTERLLDELARV